MISIMEIVSKHLTRKSLASFQKVGYSISKENKEKRYEEAKNFSCPS